MIAVRLSLFATTLLVAASCGSGDRRDQWYGSDVGVGWGDGAILSARLDSAAVEAGPEAGPEVASDAPGVTDSAADIASAADAGALADSASIVDAPKDGTD
jgi:hypothetical protein